MKINGIQERIELSKRMLMFADDSSLAPGLSDVLRVYASEVAQMERCIWQTPQDVADDCTDTGARARIDANARSIRDISNRLSTLEGRVNANRTSLIDLQVREQRIRDALCEDYIAD